MPSSSKFLPESTGKKL